MDNMPNKLDELDKFINITDKFESLYTILVYDQTIQSIIDNVTKKLGFVKLMKDPFKKKYLNDRLFSLVKYLEDDNDNYNNNDNKVTVNCIYLVGKQINVIKLSKKNINVLKEYDVDKFIFKYGSNFDIDYLNKLLFDINFKDVIHCNNNKVSHIHLNSTKRKVLYDAQIKDPNTIITYIKEHIHVLNKSVICHGTSPHLKHINNNNPNNISFNKNLSDEEILKIFDDSSMCEKHEMLKICLDSIQNEKLVDRVIFGKDIDSAIQNYTIKTLFCTPIMYKKIFQTYPKELLNFEIIEIRKVTTNNISDQFDILKNSYKGIIGYTYY